MRFLGIRIEVSPYLLILVAAAIFLLPVRWLTAMLIAAAVHETGHVFALYQSGIPIEKLSLSLKGARICVKPLTRKQEFFCACAGPGAAAMLIGLGRLYPELAVCAFVQTAYNLIPLMPFDGGRILRCALEAVLSTACCERIMTVTEIIVCGMILLLGIFFLLDQLFLAALVTAAFLLVRVKRKIACKGELSAVQ